VLAMQDQERRRIRGAQPGRLRHGLEPVLEEGHDARPREGRDGVGHDLAHVGAGQPADARVAGLDLRSGGDGPRLQQEQAVVGAQDPLHVLRRPEQVLGPAGQGQDAAEITRVQARALGPLHDRGAAASAHVAVGAHRSRDHGIAAAGMRFHQPGRRIVRMAREGDSGGAGRHEPLHQHGHGAGPQGSDSSRVSRGVAGRFQAGPRGADHRLFAAHVEDRAVLSREAGLVGVFERRGGADGHRAPEPRIGRAQRVAAPTVQRAGPGGQDEAVRYGQAPPPQAREDERLGADTRAVVFFDLVQPQDIGQEAMAQGRGGAAGEGGAGEGGAGRGSVSGISARV